ncbi:MAG: hypothetical protein HY304_07920 [candidate division Zixibacteria bacterium]|nr:hypothetical protein [candidate division Zixibacteria bacterium]
MSGMLLYGCSHPPPLTEQHNAASVTARLKSRADSVASAAYRIRWRSIGTGPHAEFIMEIAYRAPGRFRIAATGPFGVPAFTAVVIGDAFWFVDHHDGRYVSDQMANLGTYDIPAAEFFATAWRYLFAGGWGGDPNLADLESGGNPDELRASGTVTDWVIKWDWRHQVPKKVTAVDAADPRRVLAEVWFDRTGKRFPYWEINRLRIRDLKEGGEHKWTLLKQKYNIPLPDRLFEPLRPPRR